ncbi:hypothetical protein [Aeromonas veronii]|uniref:hypothetical protein n=1 Tax=Aeromonas veronii TaxID=654 RepID=UPI003B9F1DC0
MIEKVNDDVCAIEPEVIKNALGHLMGGINLNENTSALDKHVVLKNSNYIYELHDFPPFVLVNKDIATHVARALDDVSIKTYYDDLADAFYNDENGSTVTYDQVHSDWARSNMPSYYMPGGDYQSAENFLAEMGADNVNESTIKENYKMAINVLSRVKV